MCIFCSMSFPMICNQFYVYFILTPFLFVGLTPSSCHLVFHRLSVEKSPYYTIAKYMSETILFNMDGKIYFTKN